MSQNSSIVVLLPIAQYKRIHGIKSISIKESSTNKLFAVDKETGKYLASVAEDIDLSKPMVFMELTNGKRSWNFIANGEGSKAKELGTI